MRAAVLYAPGPADSFKLEEVPKPFVSAVDDVLVRVKVCGVSYRDVVERNGTYRRDVSFPLIMGLEIAGVVEAIGPGVQSLGVGDHVCSKAFSSCGSCGYCRSGRETTCTSRRPVRGGYAEYTVLPEDALVKAPASLSFSAICSLGPGAGVALNAVRDVANVRLGDSVLVTGASGGVGLPAVRLARLQGAEVIALTRSEKKKALLKSAGAEHVIVSSDFSDLKERVNAITRHQGVDVVIDTVGSAVFEAAFDALGRHGRYAVVGQLNADKASINLARIFFKRAQILGVGSVSRKQLADTIDLVARDALQPVVAKSFKLEDVAAAHRLVESADAIGRVILIP